MSFQIGQRYQSPSHAHRRAEVVHVDEEGGKAFVEIHAEDGSVVNSGWVQFEQFGSHWFPEPDEAMLSMA